MIKDNNLAFLRVADNDDLKTLVDYLIPHESKGLLDFFKNTLTRISGELTKKESFKKYYPNNIQTMTDDVIVELQKFGGSTLANSTRGGRGVEYSEILADVAKQVKSPFDKNKSIEENEYNLLCTILLKSLDDPNLSDKDVKRHVEELGIKAVGGKQAMIAALQVAIKSGGFASYQIAVIVANAISKAILGRGLALAANAGLVRYMAGFAGRIGWVLTGLWTLVDISGPAYRITIPAVIHIAYMRQKFNNEAYNYSR